MGQATEAVVYNGMTPSQLAEAYNVFATIPDVEAYQQEGAALHEAARDRCPAVTDVAYGDTPIEKLDIYAPANAKGSGAARPPVLIDVHGGGFTMGTKNTRAIPAPAVISRGALWVPIDYGLAPDYRMDTIVGHVRKAVAWVHGRIADYGGDPDRIYISGNSAGAYLTATTLMPGWHGDYGIPEDTVKGVCLMSGVFDLDPMVLAASGPNDALAMTLEDSARLSPIRHLPREGCPILVSYGAPELESFISQSIGFAKAWKDAGFPVETIVVPGAHHMAMSRELANTEGALFKALMRMIGV